MKYAFIFIALLTLSACDGANTTDTATPIVYVPASPPMNINCAVYDLSQDGLGSGAVPDFNTLTPVASIQLGTINAPTEPVTSQFQLFSNSVAALLSGAYGLNCQSILIAPTTGTYVFSLGSDDGSQLFIDGVKVIDNNYNHGMQFYTVNYNLTAGTHKFRVAASQNGQGGQGLQVAWEEPGDNFYSIIPTTSFGQ